MPRLLVLRAVTAIFFLVILSGGAAADDNSSYIIFDHGNIFYQYDAPGSFSSGQYQHGDRGRWLIRDIELPETTGPMQITAHVTVYPVPKDEQSVYDSYDRAGNIRLVRDSMAEIELVKFITAYGGETSYDVDLSQLAPLLQGKCRFLAEIDTWVNPAWQFDFSLSFTPIENPADSDIYINYVKRPDWEHGLVYLPHYWIENYGDSGCEVSVEIPEGLERVLLYYYTSGHCGDGMGADEFVPKDNVIRVDNDVIYRFQPWRDDCRDFRAINPYCRKWPGEGWSSDFSRSGWCPGDLVAPTILDLTDHLTPGEHTVKFTVENVRPVNDKGFYGYWRISSYLIGWKEKVNTVKW